jgi:hypothetical protein
VFEQAARTCGDAVPVTMVPLEVTHTALVTEEVLQRIRALGGNTVAAPKAGSAAAAAVPAAPVAPSPSVFSTLICDLLLFFRESYARVFGFSSPPLHDPCAVLFVLRPDLFATRRMRVDVDTVSSLCAGRTVCDVYNRSGKPANVTVALSMDVPSFWDHMLAALEKANEGSSLNGEGAGDAAAAAAAAAPSSSSASGTTAPLLVEDSANPEMDVSAHGPLAVRVQNLPPLSQTHIAAADRATATPTPAGAANAPIAK